MAVLAMMQEPLKITTKLIKQAMKISKVNTITFVNMSTLQLKLLYIRVHGSY